MRRRINWPAVAVAVILVVWWLAVIMALLPQPAQAAPLAPAPGMSCTYLADWTTAKDYRRVAVRVLVLELAPLPSTTPGAWVREPLHGDDRHVAAADLFECAL